MDKPSSPPKLQLGMVVPATCLLVLVHFGQDVLRPIAIAAVLSLVIAPLARKLTRLGLGHTAGTLLSVLLVGVCVAWMAAVLALQLAAVGAGFAQYREAIVAKVESVRSVTASPFERIDAELKGMAPPPPAPAASGTAAPPVRGGAAPVAAGAAADGGPLSVRILKSTPTAGDIVSRIMASLWGPIGEAGIVFVLLVFILLERESLSDRFIRVIGVAELGPTVQALSDTAQGVSRYFMSQSVVNATFGVVVGLGLWAIGIPHAALWGSISALLRFVPYVGVLGAAGLIALFGAAVDPGWTLVLSCLGLFAALELLVANVVEPQVYGHSTGLAPLAVIVSALFWGAMWGPVGLLLSTPLTLCLVIVGRHVRALRPLAILLTDAPGLNAGQRFYQRALSGNIVAIMQDARAHLRRSSFARYCDQVLLPGLMLAGADFRQGRIDDRQRDRLRETVVTLTEQLSAPCQPGRSLLRGRRRTLTLADANVGILLRKLREARLGPWQGRLDVPSQSVVLCVGLGSERDDLLTELLVRALRQDAVDARSVTVGEAQDPALADKGTLVGTIFLAYPRTDGLEGWQQALATLRERLPHAVVAAIRLPLDDMAAAESMVEGGVDVVLHSYCEAEALVLQGAKAA